MWSKHELSRRSFLGGAVAIGTGLATDLPIGEAAGRPDNIRASNDAFTAHAETCVAANPRNPGNLLGASIVYAPKAASGGVATYVSFDGGISWRSNGLLGKGDDPTVTFDAAGHGFVCASGPRVWRTDDGGRSFTAPVAVVEQEQADHPWLAADRFDGPRAGHLYGVWSTAKNTQLAFSRSTDGGQSFEPPHFIAALSGPNETTIASPMVAAAPHGGVHAIYGVWPPVDTTGARRPEIVAHVRVVSSNDYGATFSDPVELGMGAMEIWMPGGAASSPGLPTIAASPHGDAIYAAYVTHQTGADHTDLVIATSRDRGRSWSPAVPVNRGAEPVFYFQPQLAIDEAGRIGLSAFALMDGRADLVLFVSEPHRPRFGPPLRVTDHSFDPAQGSLNGGGKHGAWWIGDYQGLAAGPGTFHPLWNDTRTGRLELFTASARVGISRRW